MKKTCSFCGSDKYYAKGFCRRCYNKFHKPTSWSKEYSRCVDCGKTEHPHVAKGLCRRCYSSQPSQTLCACGCGLFVPIRGNVVRKYRKGHWMRGNIDFLRAHVKSMLGKNNPQYGKFGKEHPAYGHKTKPEVREARRKRRIKLMSERSEKKTDIERILSEILDDMNIEHTSQMEMYEKFCVDEFLPEFNVVIEAHGGYWHGDSRKFPSLAPIQKKNVKRDFSKCKYLNKCGHRVLILWEEELKNNKEFCKSEIILAIKNSLVPDTQDSVNVKPF